MAKSNDISIKCHFLDFIDEIFNQEEMIRHIMQATSNTFTISYDKLNILRHL